MAVDQRGVMWEKSFDTYYQCYFEELVADSLVYRWLILDDVTKVLVALTASGSAIAGWSLWSSDDFKWLWALLAGFGALLSVIHASLGVPSRVKQWEGLKRTFAKLRIEIETFRQRMAINPNFELDAFVKEYSLYRKRYGEAMQQLQGDIVRTRRFEEKIQDNLNEQIADQIQ